MRGQPYPAAELYILRRTATRSHELHKRHRRDKASMFIDRPIKSLLGLLFLWFILYAFFRDFSGADIASSKLFFSETTCTAASVAQHCGTFPWGQNAVLSTTRSILFFLPADLLIAMVAWAVDDYYRHPDARNTGLQHNVRILAATWFISVVVIVNVWLKEYSGRPRPASTTLFGGDLDFRAVADFSGACTSNCSFISGEAASAGWILCTLAILPARWRRILWVPVTALAVFTAFLRVSFGRHFLSDAVLGFLSAPVVFTLLIALFGWKKIAEKS